MRTIHRIRHALAGLLLLGLFGSASASAQSQTVLTFSKDIRDWRLAAGFLYLHDNCTDFSSQTEAYVTRSTLYGLGIYNLQTIDTAPDCRTFRNAAADESGFYYYNRQLGRIEAIYSDQPYDLPTPLASIGDWDRPGFGDGISALRLHGNHIYWLQVEPNGEFSPDTVSIKRLSKSGGSVTTLFTDTTSNGASYEGLAVTQRYIWWTDSSGLNRISSCLLQPCLPGSVEKTIEVSGPAGGGFIEAVGDDVLWWSGDASPEVIRRTRCPIFGGCSTTTVHSAQAGTRIVGLAANASYAAWVENVPFFGNRLRRKAFGGADAATLEENLPESRPWLSDNVIYFQSGPSRLSRISLFEQGLSRELGIAGIEVTQAIQRLNNDVPLVAGKATWVRVYPELLNGEDAGAVAAALHGTRAGQPLPGSPIYPQNVSIPVRASGSLADRMTEAGGWLFRLPESWTRSGAQAFPQEGAALALRAVIDPLGAYADTDNSSNNESQTVVNFVAKAPICMRLRPVDTSGSQQSATGYSVSQVLDIAESLMPTPGVITFPSNEKLREIDWCWKGPAYGPFCSSPYELDDDESGLLTKMGWLAYWSDSPDICLANNARTLYAGIVDRDADWEWSGLARRGGVQLLSKVPRYGDPVDRSGVDMTMAHEMGHSFGRRHVDCNDPKNPDLDFPYPTNRLDFDLDLDDPDLHFGFDALLERPVAPMNAADFLSYCNAKWTTDYTWKAIFDQLRDPVFTVSAAMQAAPEPVGLVRISGRVDPIALSGELDHAWSLPATETSAEQRAARDDLRVTAAASTDPWHVQLLGRNGTILADEPVSLTPTDDGSDDAPLPFHVVLAAPNVEVLALRLLHGSTVVATRTAGRSMPTVDLLRPSGGENVDQEIQVEWAAADADDDDLLYTVLYSSDDGQTWQSLVANWGGSGTTRESLTLDLRSVPGGGTQSSLIRILVSDGYNTNFATSGPFTVGARAPAVAITRPLPGEVFAAEEAVTLNGAASDPEDGHVPAEKFWWSTGAVGPRARALGLPPGTHEIELLVADSDVMEATARVSFSIAPLAVPLATEGFSLDGRCDDDGYAAAPQLPLTPYPGGARASARLAHDPQFLWVCFANLRNSGGHAGLLLDTDNSRDPVVASGDYGVFVSRDGTPFVREGDGSDFIRVSAGPLSARIFEYDSGWSAELRVRRTLVGDWQRRVSLALGHFEQAGSGMNRWPVGASRLNPPTWALTNFGLPGRLTGIIPRQAIVGMESVSLTVLGSGFGTDSRVLWNGMVLPTTFVDGTTLESTVPADLLTTAGIFGVAVGDVMNESLRTAAQPFPLLNPQPVITGLSPSAARMGAAELNVSVLGTGFRDGAVVFWNGSPRATTRVSDAELSIALNRDDLSGSRPVPVVVVNPNPALAPSREVRFEVVRPEPLILSDGFE